MHLLMLLQVSYLDEELAQNYYLPLCFAFLCKTRDFLSDLFDKLRNLMPKSEKKQVFPKIIWMLTDIFVYLHPEG